MSGRPAVVALSLVGPNHPVLRRRADDVVDFDAAARIARRMEMTRRLKRGLAVAAPQVGKPLRIVVAQDRTLVNPVIVDTAGELLKDQEGCLTFPGQWFLVPRWERVTVHGFTLSGAPVTVNESDLFARMWQHEIDHLDGRLIKGHYPAYDPIAELRRHA